jgi:hypothetical protein
MFSNEWLVVIEDLGEKEIASFLVDRSFVQVAEQPRQQQPVMGKLLVAVGHEQTAGRVNITLPVASGEVGRVVTLPSGHLV